MAVNTSLNRVLLFCCALFLSGGEVFAQTTARPGPLPMPAAIVPPRDTPYPGTIRLSVDATDTDRHIFSVRETIPVRGGDSIVLLYPQWLPGNHSPTGRIDKGAFRTGSAHCCKCAWRGESANPDHVRGR